MWKVQSGSNPGSTHFEMVHVKGVIQTHLHVSTKPLCTPYRKMTNLKGGEQTCQQESYIDTYQAIKRAIIIEHVHRVQNESAEEKEKEVQRIIILASNQLKSSVCYGEWATSTLHSLSKYRDDSQWLSAFTIEYNQCVLSGFLNNPPSI